MKTHKKIIFLLYFVADLIIYYLNYHVIDESHRFWHSYVTDLRFPFATMMWAVFLGFILGFGNKFMKWALIACGAVIFYFGVHFELNQGAKGDPWDVVCYAVGVIAGYFFWLYIFKREED